MEYQYTQNLRLRKRKLGVEHSLNTEVANESGAVLRVMATMIATQCRHPAGSLAAINVIA